MHRFLQADSEAQNAADAQNYNRYNYCNSNPLKFTDPSGNNPLMAAILIGMAISGGSYLIGCLINHTDISIAQLILGVGTSVFSSAVTFGIGSAVNTIGNFYIKATVQALAHGTFQGAVYAINGGNFWNGFAAGSISSLASSAWSGGDISKGEWNGIGGNFADSGVGMIAFGTIAGGAGAALTGGNFWQGAVTGLVVSGLNHAMHEMDNAYAKGKLDREVDAAYGSQADSEAPATRETLYDMKDSLPTLKSHFSKTGSVGMYAQPDISSLDDGSIAKTYAHSENNFKNSRVSTTYFKDSFKSYRTLARSMLHEFGHCLSYINGDFYDYHRSHTKAQTDSWKERYAFNYAFVNGGVPYKNDPWYIMNSK